MDDHDGPHQSSVDEKDLHQVLGDGNGDHQSSTDVITQVCDGVGQCRSTITGRLCKRVLAYIKWRSGTDVDIDASVMDSLGRWLHNSGISVYIDPV
jgi:hypothetical protein